MKKICNLFLIMISLFIFIKNVNAIDYNTPVYNDMTYSQCINYQDSALHTTGSGYFGHCIKATCYSGVWQTFYYISDNIVTCSNGNTNKYTQLVKTGCSGYVGSCTPTTRERYCSIITYYDCNKTAAGTPFTTTTKSPPLTSHTTITTTKKPIIKTTKPIITEPVITTPVIKSSNNFIKSLSITNVELLFDKNITEYTIKLDEEINTLQLEIILEDTKSNYVVENIENINRDLPIKIIVTAEDQTIREYIINIKPLEEILDSNSKLNNMSIEGFSINFDSEIFTYDITITNQNSLNIIATPQSETSNYYISGNNDLKNKSQITITVKAEDASETKYIINVKKSSNFAGTFIVILIVLVAGFVAFKILKKITFKEKVSNYEYE